MRGIKYQQSIKLLAGRFLHNSIIHLHAQWSIKIENYSIKLGKLSNIMQMRQQIYEPLLKMLSARTVDAMIGTSYHRMSALDGSKINDLGQNTVFVSLLLINK